MSTGLKTKRRLKFPLGWSGARTRRLAQTPGKAGPGASLPIHVPSASFSIQGTKRSKQQVLKNGQRLP